MTARTAIPKRARYRIHHRTAHAVTACAEHDQRLQAQAERAHLQRRAAVQWRERIEVAGQGERGQFLQLHPQGEARHHRGDGRALAVGREAQALDVRAGERRAEHGDDRESEQSGAEAQVGPGRRVAAQHDGRAIGEVDPAQHAEDQGEAEREQRVGRAQEQAVERVLREVDQALLEPR
jgi:hypothetical protein